MSLYFCFIFATPGGTTLSLSDENISFKFCLEKEREIDVGIYGDMRIYVSNDEGAR